MSAYRDRNEAPLREDSHFAFGRNWAAYATAITDAAIAEAEAGLRKLLGEERLDGRRFLDVGCGSGLHALAALRLGAAEVIAVDIDADSVATSRAVLRRFAPDGRWRVEKMSVFDLHECLGESFDVVYAWGVLHHTGDVERAIRETARMCGKGGLLILALYYRTWLDWFWRLEKRWYAKASPAAQKRAQGVYIALEGLLMRVRGERNFQAYVSNYHINRGMDFYHDVHDWLGGWPYEPLSASEVDARLRRLGFEPVRRFIAPGRWFGRSLGLLGAGNNEYVYRRVQ